MVEASFLPPDFIPLSPPLLPPPVYSCSISKFFPLLQLQVLQWSLFPFQSPSLPTAAFIPPCSYFLLWSALNSLGKELLLVKAGLVWNCSHRSQSLFLCNEATRCLVVIFKAASVFPREKCRGRGCCTTVPPAADAGWNCFSSDATCAGVRLSFVLS